ncbi:HotDog domain-containing protein [Bisporella sp. PMI_857]|nr:HotDog domain-containing protein [Bisporella sp. PMI_857]
MDQSLSSSRAIAHFKSIPWCSALLEQPGAVIFTPTARLQEDAFGRSPTQDQLFRKTLKNHDTVPHCIGFYQDPALSDSQLDRRAPLVALSQLEPTLLIKSSSLMFDLRRGVNGYNGSAHGGFIASIMDEAMGSLIFVNHEFQKQNETRGHYPQDILDLNNIRFFTASMTVRLRKPLPTPQSVIVTASLGRIDGRKMFLEVTVKGERGEEFANCDGLWISLQKEKL